MSGEQEGEEITAGSMASKRIILSARDPDVADVFPAGFDKFFEVYSYRNAARILASSYKPEFEELVSFLLSFKIATDHIVVGGKNKSQIAKSVDELLHPLGWTETRIKGDLHITKNFSIKVERVIGAGKNKGKTKIETKQISEPYVLPGFIDGHKIDFVKERVAFDLEWNSKDQTFDRDLYAMRTFYECGIIGAGVLLTRGNELGPVFAEISQRVSIEKFKSKFGASTTWMGKLAYRLDAGRAGGCPILALGIRPEVISDFEKWKKRNPIIRAADFDLSEPIDDDE